jgi:hypothetical protein
MLPFADMVSECRRRIAAASCLIPPETLLLEARRRAMAPARRQP